MAALRRRMPLEGDTADVLRVYGYAGRCKCGWAGPVRPRYDVARVDLFAHRRHEHRASH